ARLSGHVRRPPPTPVPAEAGNGRVTDFAFDTNEHHRASEELVAAAVARGRAAGAATFRSSVHLHFTFDRLDKATGALRYLRLRHHVDPTAARRLFAFIGDSEHDAPCFAAFRTTIAGATPRGRPPIGPRFITEAPQGRGFAEAARALVALRG